MNFLSVARLSIFTWKTCKAKLTWCLRRWDSKESVVTQWTQEVCLIWLIGVIAGVMNSKNYELEVDETWWNLDSCVHGRSYTWRGLDWLPTSKASRNLSRYFKCAHVGLWRAFTSWTRLAVHQAGCHSTSLSLCCWPKKVDRTMNEHDFYIVSNTSTTRCKSSKVWGELPIFYDVQRSLDCFSWFAQTHWCSFIIQNADFRFSMHVTLWQWGNALWQLVCNTLQLGEKEHEGVNTHAYHKCWFGSVLVCFRSVGSCLISSYFIFSMFGTVVNLTWRQVGSCRPFCKLQVCVRDDREVRDESCRSFTRNFGGAIFWCWVWLRWNNAKNMILKTLPESNILFKETHFLDGEQTRVSAWLVLRNFFSALRSGRNVQEAFEQPVCFSALSSSLDHSHPFYHLQWICVY